MQLAAAQLAAHLQRGLKPLYTVHTDEALLAQEALDAIRAAARAEGYTERTVHVVQGAHFNRSEVLAAGQSMSLFGDRQMVEVRIPSGKPGKEGSVALQRLAEMAPQLQDTITLVTLPKLEPASQKTAWFGALEANGVTIKIDNIDRRNLTDWLARRLQAAGMKVAGGEEGQRTLAFFADRVEGNLLAAHQEIQKLALVHGAQSSAQPVTLSFETVEQAVLNVARYDVFKLTEAVLAGQTERAIRMLDGLLAEGEAEVLIHYTLASDITALARVRQALDAGRPLPMAMQEQRVWGVKQQLMERVLPRLSSAQTRQWLHAAHAVDGIVKGLRGPTPKAAGPLPQTPKTALRELTLSVARGCAAA